MVPGYHLQRGVFYSAVLLQNVDCNSSLGSKIDLMVCIHHFKKSEIEHNRIENIKVSIVSENYFFHTRTYIYRYTFM